MAGQLPPKWALERVFELYRSTPLSMENTFARYIAEHEEAPVDPLLIEAREIVAKGWGEGAGAVLADECRQGLQDNDSEVRMALAGLRRGIEIGKAS